LDCVEDLDLIYSSVWTKTKKKNMVINYARIWKANKKPRR
jgi:hypothetical protein